MHRFRPTAQPRPEGKASAAATDTSAVGVVDDDSFFDLTADGYTVVEFGAQWHGPCRALRLVFHAVAAAHRGPVRFASCDIDAAPGTAGLLQIQSIPTLVVFGPDGSEVGRAAGAVPRGDLETTVRYPATR